MQSQIKNSHYDTRGTYLRNRDGQQLQIRKLKFNYPGCGHLTLAGAAGARSLSRSHLSPFYKMQLIALISQHLSPVVRSSTLDLTTLRLCTYQMKDASDTEQCIKWNVGKLKLPDAMSK
jgi:hypothetical protein